MTLRQRIEALFEQQVAAFTDCPEFRALERGTATLEEYDRFVANVVQSHLESPRELAFLFSVAPPESAGNCLRAMLSELGILEGDSSARPAMLRELARGAGLGPRLPELEDLAAADLRQSGVDPLLFGSLREVGLSVLCEAVAFSYLLGRTARRFATALAAHRGLSAATLEWFSYRSEVDPSRSRRGLDDLVSYLDYYDIRTEDALAIIELTLRENAFIKRYFGAQALGEPVSERS